MARNSTQPLVLLSLLLTAGALTAREPAPAVPRVEIAPYPFRAADGQTVEAERGVLIVPENRKKPGGRTIRLAFVRFKATGQKPGPPIVYLAGGPGGSGIGAATGARFPLFLAMREFGDVIAFDQRGTGSSEPAMLCPESGALPLGRPGAPEDMIAVWGTAARDCAEGLRRQGIDLAAYNTEESADDLNDLRQALGAEKISLWGISYGTHLALATLKRHGPHVHRAILAGLEGPDQTEKPPRQQQELLEAISALVKKDPEVGPAVPDLLGLMRTVLARLEKEPVTVDVADPKTGQTIPMKLSKFDLQLATANLVVGPDSFAVLPDLYSRLAAGDWLALAYPVVPQRAAGRQSAMTFAMDCASGATAARRKRIADEAKTTLLGDVINFPFPAICAFWNVPDLGDGFRANPVSDVPVLFISGTLDGRTPPENTVELLRGFKNGVHLVIEGAGHSDPLFLSSPKILQSMQAFMRSQPLPVTRIELPPPDFLAPRKVANVSREVLSRYVGTYRIAENDERKVFLVGDQLFSQRTNGAPQPLRPQSETEFFYEGTPTRLRFVVTPEGKVTHMVFVQGGKEEKVPKAG